MGFKIEHETELRTEDQSDTIEQIEENRRENPDVESWIVTADLPKEDFTIEPSPRTETHSH